tara:strand:+ start:8641 stop:9837 length:1197 start_codon:yes stop_codon:yes gene_type:complete
MLDNPQRIIGLLEGDCAGPTVVFFGGIHGNETAGVKALEHVFKTLKTLKTFRINGTFYGITGNLNALKTNQRYIDEDLNRLWTKAQIAQLEQKTILNSEEKEQLELFSLLNQILNTNNKPFYFVDLHTTSSKTHPFITINDALINRKFSNLFPVPTVLGIEEYLNGPLLSYINQLGYVSLGFESGQHTDPKAVTNSIAFIYLTLVYAQVLPSDKLSAYYYNHLKTEGDSLAGFFEVVYLYKINSLETFVMQPDFKSFQPILKNTLLATSNGKQVKAKRTGSLFMPLYQAKGKEGFFIIRTIPVFFLKLSELLRQLHFDSLLILLPGISRQKEQKDVLLVNLKVVRFFAKSLFHLLGYRNQHINHTHVTLYSRERVSKKAMYNQQLWYKRSLKGFDVNL